MGSLSGIDLPILDLESGHERDLAEKLVSAATQHGFVYVRNLGRDIPTPEIDNVFDISKTFFATSVDEKERFKINESNRGWSGMHTETLDAKTQRIGDFKEAFNLGDSKSQAPLPPTFQSNKVVMNSFFGHCHALCQRLLTLFAIGLKIPALHGGSDFFTSRHDTSSAPSGNTLRLLHYPSIPSTADYNPDVDIRAGAHSDYGSITLLFQRPGQPGLEILTPANEWVPVAVSPAATATDPSPPILVNIGDLLSYWTNGLLKSTVHRVIFPKDSRRGGEDRYSIAFFCHPVEDTLLEPVPSELVSSRQAVEDRTANGKTLTAQEHLQSRLKASYLSLYKDDVR